MRQQDMLRKRLQLTLFSVLCMAAVAQIGYAQAASGQPGAFLRLGVGARALSLGGAFTALADDPSAGFWNAAGLSQIDQLQFSAAYSDLALGRTYNYAGAAVPFGRSSSLGLSWINLSVSGIEGRSGNSETPDFLFGTSEHALLLTYARRVNSMFSLGTSVKMIYQQLYESDAMGVGFDFSMLLRPTNNLQLGLSIQDIGTTTRWNSGLTERFPLTYRAGLAIFPTPQLALAVDAYQTRGGQAGFAVGAEYRTLNILPVRIGYTEQGIVGGAGLIVPLQAIDLHLDYAYGRDQIIGDESHKFSLGVSFTGGRSSSVVLGERGYVRETTAPPPPSKEAVKGERQIYLEVVASGLNVRKGPGVDQKRIAVIRQGERFKKITAEGYWYKIELSPGEEGWVHYKYVKEVLQ